MLSPFSLRRTATDIARARHISEVLVRNGLGFLVEVMGLARFAPSGRGRARGERLRGDSSVPERVRRTLEELGPTYIKLGQIASTRPDVLPPAYIAELSRLLDAAQPVAADEVRRTLEEELGAPLEQHFAHFVEEPIASASIGQVHRATLHDGAAVVVKVQRPGVERTVQADLDLLNAQARFLCARSATLRAYGVADLVDEFSHALRSELDYTAEARNVERLEHATQGVGARVPKVHWDLTTRRVITLSDLGGVKLSEIERLKAAGHDLPALAERVVTIYLRLVFDHGIFHGDPHPANILVAEDGEIGLVDFGAVGYLTPQMREHLGGLLIALVQQDADAVVRRIVRMGAAAQTVDRRALQRDVHRLLLRYYDASLASVPIAEFLSEVMSIAFRHHMRLPADLALLARTVIVLEGVARGLDPTFILARHLRPFVVQLVREPFSLRRTVHDSLATLHELDALLKVLPRRVDVISEQLEAGGLNLGVELRQLSAALRKLDAIGNRLAFSVIVAAIVIGSALILSAGERAAAFQIPFLNLRLPVAQVGFLVAGLLGAWLLFSIVRSRGL